MPKVQSRYGAWAVFAAPLALLAASLTACGGGGAPAVGSAAAGATTGAAVTPVKGFAQGDKTFSIGSVHAAVIRSDGNLYTFGSNLNGQLGTGNTISSIVPTLVNSVPTWSLISTGAQFTVGVRSAGTLWTWGYNTNGQLGQNAAANATVVSPTQITITPSPIAISAGDTHAAMVLSDNSLWAWGGNVSGQVGNGTTTDTFHPVQVGTLKVWDSVSAGAQHTLARQSSGANPDTLWAWGSNGGGQLGQFSGGNQSAPVQVNLVTSPVAVFSAGGLHSLAITTDGQLWSWGTNDNGQIGDNSSPISNSTTFLPGIRSVLTAPSLLWSRVAAGGAHSLALAIDGTLWSWGDNTYGQLGNGASSVTGNAVITQVGTDNHWIAISAGKYSSMGVKSDGSLWVWGRNDAGQLGLGNVISPVTVPTQLH